MNKAEILRFNGITRLDIPSDRILKEALKMKVSDAIVIGYDQNGDFYFSSSKADGGSVVWLLEIAKKKLLEMGD